MHKHHPEYSILFKTKVTLQIPSLQKKYLCGIVQEKIFHENRQKHEIFLFENICKAVSLNIHICFDYLKLEQFICSGATVIILDKLHERGLKVALEPKSLIQ